MSWSAVHYKLVSQAQTALFAIKAYLKLFDFPVVDSFNIFDSMVNPILCFASQFLGYDHVDTIEYIHIKFCNSILYVRRNTNTCMVRGECGRLPLCTAYYINCIRY